MSSIIAHLRLFLAKTGWKTTACGVLVIAAWVLTATPLAWLAVPLSTGATALGLLLARDNHPALPAPSESVAQATAFNDARKEQ